MRAKDLLIGAAVVAAVVSPVLAAETIKYSYDARGRLIQVSRSGDVNNGVITNYSFDEADNRLLKETSGSPNPPPP